MDAAPIRLAAASPIAILRNMAVLPSRPSPSNRSDVSVRDGLSIPGTCGGRPNPQYIDPIKFAVI
jgi:hypothetical protein